jgi:thiamine biosynthesis lipoprotein
MHNMRETRDIMGMPITIEIVEGASAPLSAVFDYFTAVDERFSTYKSKSEIMKINRGELQKKECSDEVKQVFSLAEQTEKDTNGYFSIIRPDSSIDPSGLVKGWAMRNATALVQDMGYKNYFIDAGGDIQSSGNDADGRAWTVGIRNPFNRSEIVKVLRPQGWGVATSGTYIRGQHIYNPHNPEQTIEDIVSITVIGPDIYEADRFATAAFAMGRKGIVFIEQLPNFEAYLIDATGIATMTSGFERFIA